MSYMALYRKWRPDEFQEVKGQEHIVTTLKNQITHDRIGHAYLFCGTRGTGKTSIAKLMAKAVNCEHPIDGSPCNECASCKAIASGNSMNVVEIDAASNNGVDYIRQINGAVQYSPSTGKYLVYIIDEVHMLSIGAFNALLKTLEEPPSYVIFILATTEVHKIPITILSRCQRYDFRRITIETIADRLRELLEREKIEASDDALLYVAKAADGSMRDALSILDQCISFNLGETLTYEKVLETIGAVDVEIYISLFEATISGDTLTAVDIVDKAIWQGKDLSQFVTEYITFIRNVLMLKISPDMRVDLSPDNISKLIELGRDTSEGYLINLINILQDAANKLAYTVSKRVVLEVAIIKMSRPSMQEGYDSLERRVEELEQSVSALPSGVNLEALSKLDVSNLQAVSDLQAANIRVGDSSYSEGQTDSGYANGFDLDQSDKIINNLKNKYREAEYDEIRSIISVWHQFRNDSMKLTRKFLDRASVVPGDVPSTIDLVIERSSDNALAIDYFEKKENIMALEKKLAELTERTIHIGLRKVNPGEQMAPNVRDYDLSKVNFKIDYK